MDQISDWHFLVDAGMTFTISSSSGATASTIVLLAVPGPLGQAAFSPSAVPGPTPGSLFTIFSHSHRSSGVSAAGEAKQPVGCQAVQFLPVFASASSGRC
jgi:hypothetical protein